MVRNRNGSSSGCSIFLKWETEWQFTQYQEHMEKKSSYQWGKRLKSQKKMSWSEAAAIVTPGVTAYNLINHLLDLQPTDTVMIEGASGAVGTSLIQLLHIRGIRTLASASKKNEEKIRQLGVSDFSAYDQEDPGIKFQNQADTVIDATKGSVKGESGIQIMKEGGRYIALNDLPSLELHQKKTGFYEPFIPRKEYQDQEAFYSLIQRISKW